MRSVVLFVMTLSLVFVSNIVKANDCDVHVYNATQLHEALTGVNPDAIPSSTICIHADGSPYMPEVQRDPAYIDPDRTKSFQVMVDDLTLVGDGMHQTVLSGDIGVADDISDNAYNVIYVDPNTVTRLTVKNLTITQGNADVNPNFETDTLPFIQSEGASINMSDVNANGRLVIERVNFENNQALGFGAGIVIQRPFVFPIDILPKSEQVLLSVRHSYFKNNLSIAAGGTGISGFFVNMEVKHSHFIGNSGEIAAGIDLDEGTLILKNSRFLNNTVNNGGSAGAVRVLNFEPAVKGGTVIVNNKFINNISVGENPISPSFSRGGALLIEGNADPEALVTIKNNLFKNNQIQGVAGAVDILNANTTMTGNVFVENTSGGEAGAVSVSTLPLIFRAGVEAPKIKIAHNLFKDNSAGNTGGALVVVETLVPRNRLLSTFNVSHNVFSGNKAQSEGGAVLVSSARQVKLHKNTYIGNRATGMEGIDGSGHGGAIAVNSQQRHAGLFQMLQTPVINFFPPDSYFGGLPFFPFQGDEGNVEGNVRELVGDVTVTNSVFLRNYAQASGGAVSDIPTFEDTFFVPGLQGFGEEFAATGPGLAEITVKDSYFLQNRTLGVGGALALDARGQHELYKLCPLGVFPFPAPGLPLACPDPSQQANRPWVADEHSPLRHSTLKIKDSLLIGNRAYRGGADGEDIYIGHQIPNMNVKIKRSWVGDCDGNAC